MPELVMTDGKHWKIDATRWPVLVISRLSADIPDDALIESMAAADRMIDERGGPFSIVLDNRLAGSMSAKQRKMVTEHSAQRAAYSKLHCRGTAFVFTSSVMRGILTAIFWMRPPDVPTSVFAELDDAIRWAASPHFQADNVSGAPVKSR